MKITRKRFLQIRSCGLRYLSIATPMRARVPNCEIEVQHLHRSNILPVLLCGPCVGKQVASQEEVLRTEAHGVKCYKRQQDDSGFPRLGQNALSAQGREAPAGALCAGRPHTLPKTPSCPKCSRRARGPILRHSPDKCVSICVGSMKLRKGASPNCKKNMQVMKTGISNTFSLPLRILDTTNAAEAAP